MGESNVQRGKRAADEACGPYSCRDENDCCKHCGAHIADPCAPDCKHADEPADECDARPAEPEHLVNGVVVAEGRRVRVDDPHRALGGWWEGAVRDLEVDRWVGLTAFTVVEDGGARKRFEVDPKRPLRLRAIADRRGRDGARAHESVVFQVYIELRGEDNGVEVVRSAVEVLLREGFDVRGPAVHVFRQQEGEQGWGEWAGVVTVPKRA